MRTLLLTFIVIPAMAYSQWTLLQSGTNMGFFSCSFVNADTGWVAGQEGKVFYTSNGGSNWSLIFDSQSTDRFECMIFKNAFSGWAGTWQGYVYRTSDGGHNWSYQHLVYYTRILDIFFTNIDTGWVVGQSNFYRKTTNGGITWFQPNTGPGNCLCIYFLNNSTGFGGSANNIGRSTDGGENWNFTNLTDRSISAFYFINQQTGWALGSRMFVSIGGSALCVLKTQNGGLNWSEVCSDTTVFGWNLDVQDAHFVNEIIGYYCGFRSHPAPPASQWGVLCKTTNSGTNWTSINLGISIYSVEAIDFANLQTGYAVGRGGSIFKTTNGGPVGSISPEIELPVKYHLSQNYPNPFNPITKIKFDIPPSKGARGKIRLVILDILGREVATLVNECLQPGPYVGHWDGTNYPSGVYFYKLIAEDYSETRKMVLIK